MIHYVYIFVNINLIINDFKELFKKLKIFAFVINYGEISPQFLRDGYDANRTTIYFSLMPS